MVKRIVIAGCRNYNNYKKAKEIIDSYLLNIPKGNKIIILSGGCRGAGPKRNEEMAKICDHVICFWDGKSKGTKAMIDYAKKYNKPIRVEIIK